MEDDSTGRRYGTRATNKLFKVKDVLQPLRSPPKRKTRPAEEVAAEKIEKGLKKQRREEAQIAQEVAKKQLAEEIARVEDMHLRAQKAKQKVHPRHLRGMYTLLPWNC